MGTGEEFTVRPIAHIHTDFSSKFGIPRQSGLVKELRGRIVFEPEYRSPDALRGLEEFSHIWLIWQFSENVGAPWHATVRPPRLGGNRRVGVFASRSPFRPNSIGLSCVKLESIDFDGDAGPEITVSGADMLDGTPILDIKPYIPYADCRAEATDGYCADTKEHRLRVDFPPELLSLIPETGRDALIGVLERDPRPGYSDSPEKSFGLEFAGFDVGFSVTGGDLTVTRIEKLV